MVKRLSVTAAAVLLLAGFGAFGQDSDMADVAAALGLSRSASKAEVLRAINSMKAKPAVEQQVDKAIGRVSAGKYEVVEPTLGASEKKGTWYGRAEALFLFREDFDGDRPLAVLAEGEDGDGEPARTVIAREDLTGGIEPGMRLTLGHQLTEATSLELTYFGLHQWEGRKSVVDHPEDLQPAMSWFINDHVGDFLDAEQYDMTYETVLHSGEFNVRHQVSKLGPFVPTIGGGIRYMHIAEDFRFESYDSLPFDIDNFGVYQAKTTNNLIGLQFGAELAHAFNSWAALSITGKAGVLANFAGVDYKLFSGDEGINGKADAGAVRLAGLAEFSAGMTFQPHKNVDVRFGYNATFVTGLSLAPDQYPPDIPNQDRILTNGSLLFHGPNVGLTVKF